MEENLCLSILESIILKILKLNEDKNYSNSLSSDMTVMPVLMIKLENTVIYFKEQAKPQNNWPECWNGRIKIL